MEFGARKSRWGRFREVETTKREAPQKLKIARSAVDYASRSGQLCYLRSDRRRLRRIQIVVMGTCNFIKSAGSLQAR